MKPKFILTENDPTWGSVCTVYAPGAVATITPAPMTSPEMFRIVCGTLARGAGAEFQIHAQPSISHAR